MRYFRLANDSELTHSPVCVDAENDGTFVPARSIAQVLRVRANTTNSHLGASSRSERGGSEEKRAEKGLGFLLLRIVVVGIAAEEV